MAVDNFADEFGLPIIFGGNRFIFYTLLNPTASATIKQEFMSKHRWQIRLPSKNQLNVTPGALAALALENNALSKRIRDIESSNAWKWIHRYAITKARIIGFLPISKRKSQ